MSNSANNPISIARLGTILTILVTAALWAVIIAAIGFVGLMGTP